MKKVKPLLLTMLVMLLAVLPSGSTQAASAKSKALKAYKTFLSQSSIDWCESSYMVDSSSCSFAIAYVDNNSVPELLLTSTAVPHVAGYYALYTYRNGSVKFVSRLTDSVSYYKKKGVFVSSYVGGGHLTNTYFVLKNGSAKQKLRSDKNLYSSSWTYYKESDNGRTSITKKKFKSALKKLVGTRSSKKVKKFYKNTASKRKKYLK